MKTKLIICIDGLGKDLISKENTPFLHEFGKKNYSAELESFFAFTALEYSFFTGKTPAELDLWTEFARSKNSLFDSFWLRFLSFNKNLRTYFGGMRQYLDGRTWISSLHNIPKDKLKYFDTAVKTGLWKLNFFRHRSFAFYKWPFFVTKTENETMKLIFKYESDEERLQRLLNSTGKEVYYTQLMEIDKTIHKFGKKSEKTKRVLRKIDRIIEKYACKFLIAHEDGEIFIWSDHGFADIENYIDLKKQVPKNCLAFIAGTTAHFWLDSEKSKLKLLEKLGKIKGGKILDEKTAKKYNIPLSEKYGQVIFYVSKGNYIFPNFYQKSEKEKFVSMHGYPEDRELNGIFITNKKLKKKILKMNKIIEILK